MTLAVTQLLFAAIQKGAAVGLLGDEIKISREYGKKFNVSLNKDKYYNSLVFSCGIRNLKEKKYYPAMIIFKS